MLISSRKTLIDILRNMFNQISGHCDPVTLTNKLNHRKLFTSKVCMLKSWTPKTVILLGNRVVADVFSSDEAMVEEDGSQMQYYWHLYKKGKFKCVHRHVHTGRTPFEHEGRDGLMHQQAKKHQRLPANQKLGERLSLTAIRKNNLADNLPSGF